MIKNRDLVRTFVTVLLAVLYPGMGPWGPTAINLNEIGDSCSEIFCTHSWDLQCCIPFHIMKYFIWNCNFLYIQYKEVPALRIHSRCAYTHNFLGLTLRGRQKQQSRLCFALHCNMFLNVSLSPLNYIENWKAPIIE